MKTTKFVFVIALISFSVLAFSKSEPETLSVKVTISKALESRSLVQAMYQQLDASLLQINNSHLFTFKVKHRNVVYYITGKYAEWKNFFLRDQDDSLVTKPPGKELSSRIK